MAVAGWYLDSLQSSAQEAEKPKDDDDDEEKHVEAVPTMKMWDEWKEC